MSDNTEEKEEKTVLVGNNPKRRPSGCGQPDAPFIYFENAKELSKQLPTGKVCVQFSNGVRVWSLRLRKWLQAAGKDPVYLIMKDDSIVLAHVYSRFFGTFKDYVLGWEGRGREMEARPVEMWEHRRRDAMGAC